MRGSLLGAGVVGASLIIGAAACTGSDAAAPGGDAGVEASAPSDASTDALQSGDAGADARLPVDGAPAEDAPPDAPVGAPLPVVLDQTNLQFGSLALDDTNVYFTNGQGVGGVSKAGGAPFVVANGTVTEQNVLHLVNGVLYWDSYGSQIESAPASGRNVAASDWGVFSDFALDFFVVGDLVYEVGTCDYIASLPIAPDSGGFTNFYNVGCGAGSWSSVAFDATNRTFDALDTAGMRIVRVALADATTTAIPVPASTREVAVHGGKLYWMTFGDLGPCDGGCAPTTITSAALDGSSPTLVATVPWATGVGATPLLAFDDSYLFMTVSDQTEPSVTVLRVNLATGESHAVFKGISITSIAADDADLYVADSVLGILRVTN